MRQAPSRHAAEDLRVEGVLARGSEVEILVDGEPVRAFAGETVAAALLATGKKRQRARLGQERGVYCGIGLCFDCVMTIHLRRAAAAR